MPDVYRWHWNKYCHGRFKNVLSAERRWKWVDYRPVSWSQRYPRLKSFCPLKLLPYSMTVEQVKKVTERTFSGMLAGGRSGEQLISFFLSDFFQLAALKNKLTRIASRLDRLSRSMVLSDNYFFSFSIPLQENLANLV